MAPPEGLPGNPDYPLISLVVTNLVTIVAAVLGHWDPGTTMFIQCG